MKLRLFLILCLGIFANMTVAQTKWFDDKNLTYTGVYYYPEHWDESQWERDFKRMHDLGFEFTHFAEFAWHSWSRKKESMILDGLTELYSWPTNMD